MRNSYYSYQNSRVQQRRALAAQPAVLRRFGWQLPAGSLWPYFLIATLLISLALLPFILLAGTYAIYTVQGHVFPGVTIGGLPGGSLAAGELNREQLASKIEREWNQHPRLVLTDGQRSWAIAPADLGLRIDPQATAQRAFEVGRGTKALPELLWLLRFNQQPVEPVMAFDVQAMQAGLARLAPLVDQPARNASLAFENGQWRAVPGQNGSSLLLEPTLRGLAANPGEVLRTGTVRLVMQPIAPRVADLSPALERLRADLDRSLTVQAYDPITNQSVDWLVPREVLAGWVTVESLEEPVRFGLDPNQLNAYLAQWQPALGAGKALAPFNPPADLTERWQTGRPVTVQVNSLPTSYTVEPGDTLTRIAFKVGMPYWKIQQANPGLNPDQLRAGQVLNIPSKNEMLPLPVVPHKRIVVNISQQRMWTYENGAQRSEHVISTGIDRSPTIPGIYQVRTHDLEAYASVWDLYMPHFIGIYEGWPGFMNGFHGLPTLSNGSRLWSGNLGRPVSYGCIILTLAEAEDLYYWAEPGVVVEIQP